MSLNTVQKRGPKKTGEIWFYILSPELAQGDDPPPVEVEQLVQLHQIAGHGDERPL
jgi:hypothetical protein